MSMRLCFVVSNASPFIHCKQFDSTCHHSRQLHHTFVSYVFNVCLSESVEQLVDSDRTLLAETTTSCRLLRCYQLCYCSHSCHVNQVGKVANW